VNSGSPAPGVLPLFLWFQCMPDGGMSAASSTSFPAGSRTSASRRQYS
jgi:hypothetical protein